MCFIEYVSNFENLTNYCKNKNMVVKTREKAIYKVTFVGSAVNLFLVVFKFVAGVLGHSSAMIADAVHSLSDFISDMIIVVFVKISGKPEDSDHAYGHGKYETLAAVIVGMILFVVGIGILVDGVSAILDVLKGKSLESPGWLALVAAVVSIVLKEWLFRYTIHYADKYDSSALTANAWHHRSDSYTSIATLVGVGGAMLLGQKWNFLDPLAAIVVSFFIVRASYSLMKPGFDELMEKSLPAPMQENIARTILDTPGVKALHHLRTRRVGNHTAIDVHIKMDGNMPLWQAHDIATDVEHRVKAAYGADTFIGVHMEPFRR